MKIRATSLMDRERRHSAMRYFCTHPPPLLILFFNLSFLTLALSLNISQFEVMKNICNIIHPHHSYCNPNSGPCQWHGVSCSENGGDDVVELDFAGFKISNRSIWQDVCKLPALQLLDLSYNYLNGPIPECIGRFANLKTLRLSSNNFSGSIPPQLFSLSNLEELSLSNNTFEGSIIDELSNLSNLIYVDLSGNLLSGNISSKIFNLRQLRVLRLQRNYLTGIIPLNVENGKSLQELRLDRNNLSGRIPSGIGNLPLLGWQNSHGYDYDYEQRDSVLDLSHNSFTGKIPITMCNLAFINSLDISNNMLTGEIPEALGNVCHFGQLDLSNNILTGQITEAFVNMSYLYWLNLSNNKLTGTIPQSLGNMSNLDRLDLSNNELTGSIPESLGNMSKLGRLDLSYNKLTGAIPESLVNMSKLDRLDLSNNKLTGTIPELLGNVSNLDQLDLSNNKLTGAIPESLGNMSSLDRLNLSNNKLTGKIPDTLGSMSSLGRLDLSNNKLTGTIPELLGNVNHLDWLNLSNNKLTGKIPESLGNISSLDRLDLSNNKLTGTIPETLKRIKYLNLSNNELVDSIPTARSHPAFKILGAVGAVAVFIICCVVLGVLWMRRNLHSNAEFKETFRKILEKLEHPRISYEQLLAAANSFDSSNLLSTNSFGSVYKGLLPDGTRVAVKVLNLLHEQSENMFKAECRVLQKARHRNLARIITTCSTPHFKALVFEYFSNGSLEKHLYLHSCRLGLIKLLGIATDIAHAVEYLHYDCFVQIVHCDIKPGNVLLDETMTAHLSDYGISRLMGRISANSVTSTVDLKGSVGYIAPEYGLNGMISPRGDVYSYGILLLEMLTRRRPTDNMFDGDLNLHNWVERAFPDRVIEVIDESLLIERAGKETEACLISLTRLGLLCSNDTPEARPTMRDVSNVLKFIQENFTTDTSSTIKLMPTISNLACDRGAVTNCEEASDTQSSSF